MSLIFVLSFIVSGWNCAVPKLDDIQWKSTCSLSREQLLIEFFVFYGEIPLERVLLCCFTGNVEKRKGFFKKSKYRKFFKKYRNLKDSKALSDLHEKKNRDFSGFCLQDPFDLLKNLTKSQTRNESRQCAEFVQYCRETSP